MGRKFVISLHTLTEDASVDTMDAHIRNDLINNYYQPKKLSAYSSTITLNQNIESNAKNNTAD